MAAWGSRVGLRSNSGFRCLVRVENPVAHVLRAPRHHRWPRNDRPPAPTSPALTQTRGGDPMRIYTVGYFVGSLAKGSINRKLAKALVRLAPEDLEMREISYAELPLYSYDYDADYPPAARALKEAIASVDAVLFVTPEYNRSIPGALKNAIDWASRPYGQNSFTHKPSAV